MNEGQNDGVERKRKGGGGGHGGNLKVFCYRSVNINSNRSDLWCFRFERNRRVCLLRPCWNSLEEMRERHKKDDFINAPSTITCFFLYKKKKETITDASRADICGVCTTPDATTCNSTLKLTILLYNPPGCGNEALTANICGKTRIDRRYRFGIWSHNQTTSLMAPKQILRGKKSPA